ncbi:MAG TPA: hypothetical protein ACFYEF_07065, partial [Candidatus Wunengus sp. YC63]|uniref:hypothetical protein n=1 Tax=unclassified Candidatus Wunengus TaxID=3367695 RepID=UPI00402983DD
MTGLSPVRKQYPLLGTPIYKIEPALIHRASVRWIKAQGFCAESTRNILKMVDSLRLIHPTLLPFVWRSQPLQT